MPTELSAAAERLGPSIAAFAEAHDQTGTFAAEGMETLRREGLLGALVPEELGGGGADVGDLCDFVRVLAGHCASTALAYSMHSHLVAAAVWRHRHGQGGEALLRRVTAGAFLVSTGANDWLDSNGTLVRTDGGFRFTGDKAFASGSPKGDLLVTSGRYDEDGSGPQVVHFVIPLDTEGVRLGGDWDTLGMRATGSETVVIEDAFVADEAVTLVRARGPWHPSFSVVTILAPAIISSAYVGIAQRAAALATANALGRRDDPDVQYLVGELGNHLLSATAMWRVQVDIAQRIGSPPAIEDASRAATAKTLTSRACIDTVNKAMEVAGGRAYFRASGIEKLYRDVRAAPYHPLQPKRQHRFSGRVALGLDPA